MVNTAKEPLFAGIDFGTSGCRLSLIDEEKTQHYSEQLRYVSGIQSPQLWWEAISQLLSACPKLLKKRIKAIAVDGTSGSLLLTNQLGEPVSQTLMYNDTRAAGQVSKIKKVAPLESGAQGASSGLARLMWLLDASTSNEPAHVLHQADWVLGKLSGEFGHSDENNCLKLGFDSVQGVWPDWFDTLLIPRNLLPTVHKPGTVISVIDHGIAQQLGLPEELSIIAGTTDSIAAFIATGAKNLGEAVTSLGSTLAIKFIADKPIFSPTYGVYSHRLGESWLVGGASNTGGAVLLNHFSLQQLAEMTPHLKPSLPTGLDYYPLVKKGERFPVANPEKQAVLTPKPADDLMYFQGMLEGIATIEQQAYLTLQALGAPTLRSVYSVGGGSKNPGWTEIRKNKLQVDLLMPRYTEAAYGSALLALQGISI